MLAGRLAAGAGFRCHIAARAAVRAVAVALPVVVQRLAYGHRDRVAHRVAVLALYVVLRGLGAGGGAGQFVRRLVRKAVRRKFAVFYSSSVRPICCTPCAPRTLCAGSRSPPVRFLKLVTAKCTFKPVPVRFISNKFISIPIASIRVWTSHRGAIQHKQQHSSQDRKYQLFHRIPTPSAIFSGHTKSRRAEARCGPCAVAFSFRKRRKGRLILPACLPACLSIDAIAFIVKPSPAFFQVKLSILFYQNSFPAAISPHCKFSRFAQAKSAACFYIGGQRRRCRSPDPRCSLLG